MFVASLLLAALAVTLAWPVPLLLARARWTMRSPGIALALWQSVALAGGLSMIGAMLVFGLIPFGDTLLGALGALPSIFAGPLPAGTTILNALALSGALLLSTHLILNLVRTVVITRRQRDRHRELVSLLTSPLPDRPGTRVLDHPAPVAYCLPGAQTVTVLSEGLLELLDTAQLEAVIEHERGHLRQRHDVVLVAFESWRAALPWFPIATRAHDAVAVLVEMLADDQARRTAGDDVLIQAIAIVGAAEHTPGADPDNTAIASQLALRTERLDEHATPLPVAARGTILALAGALLVIPTALLVAA